MSRTLTVQGVPRTYVLHVPAHLPRNRSAALILAFHGGGGDGAGMERLTGFSALADRAGFAVAYPDGLDWDWNDGRALAPGSQRHAGARDVEFVAALIDTLTAELRPDPRRVFATGFSNGATFTQHAAARLGGRLAAIAAVAGGMAEPVTEADSTGDPVSVLLVHGTADPVVPFGGGAVRGGRLGRELGAAAAARIWGVRDGIRATAATGELPDMDRGDGCRVRWQRWSGGRRGTEVWLYVLAGGGHTWPGGPQYLPRRYVGDVCRDFDATFAIWDFFSRHARQDAVRATS